MAPNYFTVHSQNNAGFIDASSSSKTHAIGTWRSHTKIGVCHERKPRVHAFISLCSLYMSCPRCEYREAIRPGNPQLPIINPIRHILLACSPSFLAGLLDALLTCVHGAFLAGEFLHFFAGFLVCGYVRRW